jgi:hypothetical protein
MLGGGDQLARGGKSAQFGTGGKSVSQKEWDAIFADKKPKKKKKKAIKCPKK